MSNVIDFQSKREEFLKGRAEKRADLTRQRAAGLEQIKELGASLADQVRFSLETERLLAAGATASAFEAFGGWRVRN